jgi:hypothetical protein
MAPGYIRHFSGHLADSVVEGKVGYVPAQETVILALTSAGIQTITVTVTERYTRAQQEVDVSLGEVQQH